MTRSDYQLLGAVALAVFVAFLVNACFAVSVTRRVDSASIGDEVLVSINAYRATLGKPALRFDSRLAGAADFHNRWMRDNGCFAHQCPGEPDPWQRIQAAGYSYRTASEVIGRGYLDAQDVVNGWRSSPAHNAIITGDYADGGCAMLEDPQPPPAGASGGPWWTCDFATGGSSLPVPTPTPTPRLVPVPTPTPPAARGGLPLGYVMEVTGRFSVFGLPRPAGCPSLAGTDCLLTLRVDYDLSDWSVTDYLYATYCARSDVTCRWRRK